MKKLILFLLLTGFLNAQTLQNPTYGNTTTNTLKVKTPATVTSVNYLSTVEADGSVAKILPVNLGFALDSDVVHKAGSETIPGTKTFTGTVSVQTPTVSTHAVTKAYADGLIVGLLNDRGSYNASSNLFPTTGGSGTSGAIMKGDIWFVSVAGTLGGKAVSVGDSFRALTNTPGQTAGNWSVLSSNIGYVPANDNDVVHKLGSINESITGTKTFNGGVVVNNPGIGNALDVINTGIGVGLFGNNTSSGSWSTFNSFTGSTGDLMRFTKNSVLTANISSDGWLMVPNIGVGVSPSSGMKVNILQANNSTAVSLKNGTTSSHNVLYMGNDSSTNSSFLGSYKADDSGFSNLVLQKFGGNTLINKTVDDGNALQVNGNVSASAASLPNQVPIYSQLTAIARPYKVYTAYIGQVGTGAPTVTIMENTIGAIVWTRTSTGSYLGTLTGAFTNNKTACFFQYQAFNAPGNQYTSALLPSINTLDVKTLSNGNYADSILGGFIEIRVFN